MFHEYGSHVSAEIEHETSTNSQELSVSRTSIFRCRRFLCQSCVFFWRILENEIAQVESLAALRKEWMLGSSQKRDITDGWLMFHGWIDVCIYIYSYINTPTNRLCSHKSLRNCANYPWHKLPDKRDVNRIASSPGFHPQFVSKASW